MTFTESKGGSRTAPTVFEGVWPALITPFREDAIDRETFRRLIDFQIGHGVHGVVPCGTTGESATLSHHEHRSVIDLALEAVDGRVPVLAGSGSNSTRETIALTRSAQASGAAGALLITPYYNKPTQNGLMRHYLAVADAVDLPLVLYNVPGRTAVDMLPETIARLAEHPNIIAIKEATADMERASWIRRLCGDAILLISGDDATFFPFLAVGGRGVISVCANIAPRHMVALWRHWNMGNLDAARREHEELLEINRLLFCETSPIPVKAAAAMLDLCGPELRLPLFRISEPNRILLRAEMERLALLP